MLLNPCMESLVLFLKFFHCFVSLTKHFLGTFDYHILFFLQFKSFLLLFLGFSDQLCRFGLLRHTTPSMNRTWLNCCFHDRDTQPQYLFLDVIKHLVKILNTSIRCSAHDLHKKLIKFEDSLFHLPNFQT